MKQSQLNVRRLVLAGLSVLTLGRASAYAQTQPTAFECKIKSFYRHRPDGKPGREIMLLFKGGRLTGNALIKVECNGITEQTSVNQPQGADSLAVLLPDGAGVKTIVQARIAVTAPGVELEQSIIVGPLKQWTVYIYPHSHVDIGYTNTQEFVRRLHVRNIDVAIDIARKTQNYPEGARFVWNPEANWVTDNYLQQASPEKRKLFVEAVRKGWISLDADYGNVNTSACSDEELLRLFHSSHNIAKTTGVPLTTMVQMDVAGASWGTVQAAYQNGVRGMFLYPNIGTVRRPWEHMPFYWVAPDGKTKMFFLQAWPYGFGWDIKGIKIGLGKVQDVRQESDRITTGKPLVNFLDPAIFNETALLANTPYSIFVAPWALADNALIDADLPDAVKQWNEMYAYPKLIIAGSKRILDDYEKRYSDILPQIKGDYTEYWTDGLGADTRRVGQYRIGKENIVQAEIAWAMLKAGTPSPRKLIDSAWQNCLLGAEHTWGYQDPSAPLAKQIEATKAGYFENSLKNSNEFLNETFKGIRKAESNKIAVFNTLSWQRDGLITLKPSQSKAGNLVLNGAGQPVPSQRLSTGELAFLAEKAPALGSDTYSVTSGKFEGAGCMVNNNTIANGIVAVTIDPKTGDIASILNVKTGQEYVDKKSVNGVNSYRYLLKGDSSYDAGKPTNVRLKIKENGPLVASILIEAEADGVRWLTREVKVIYGQPFVEIANSFDKISTRTKEGIHFGFDFDVPNGQTHIDIPWGIMKPNYDQIAAANGNWQIMQRWVDVSNQNTGVTLAAVEAPLFEIGYMSNLLGGAHGRPNWYKSVPRSKTLFSWPLNNHWGTNFPLEQGGVINLHYGILPHGPYDAVSANRFGMEQHRPLIAVPVDGPPLTKSWVKINNPKIFISTLKQSDDGKGMILRVRSVSDEAEKVQLTWPNGKPKKLYTCLADEKLDKAITADQTVLPQGTISYYFEI